ncbi:hypothetical protein ATK36_3128 [Amycolatopsis sulphurea]|uniref:Uncharacterized protein n=1 Tax=Amycolatopsis sulphurea TaxID=76022 RepID=A0A2A9F9M0_9PSEU|nr:hypothetical protein [Amycolatopsis sulphurea]PFG48054.1 hypothetical protein ATK36_3128 [Amycolatopsis sulphurea]
MNDQTPEPREGTDPAPASGHEEVTGSANEQTQELHSSAVSAAEPAAAPGQGAQGQGVPTPGVQSQSAPSPGAQGEGAPSPGAQGQAASPPPPPPQPPAGQQWGVPMPPPRPGGFRRFVGNRVTQLVAVGVLGLAVGGGVVGGVMAATYHPGHPTMSQHRGDHHFRGRAPIQRQGSGGQQNGGNGNGTGTGTGI